MSPRQRARRYPLGENGGLAAMPLGDQRLLRRWVSGQPCCLDESRAEQARQTLFPASDLEFFAINFRRPVNRQAKLGEGLVEGRTMAVALSFGENTVTVEN